MTSRARTTALLPLLALLGLLAPACARPAPSDAAARAVPPRKPAQVMSFHGADWLERPGRAEEERPDLVLQALALHPGETVAEIGCGTGFYSRRLARAVAKGGRVYAEDIQPEMIDLLKQYAARDGIDNILPVLGSETDPKLPAGAMDWIFLADVYHEFQQPRPMLAAIRRSLARGGRVALVEYRKEGDTAAKIHPEHRMTVEQVLAEWTPAGFELVERREDLPMQHLFIFRAAP
ncbi:MAG TPA: methyltransferase domain-containing protein [Thermoanaerobaculia bacterium]